MRVFERMSQPAQVNLLFTLRYSLPIFRKQSQGIGSLAVIMIDIERLDKLSKAQERMKYFMGASRARQLLAIFHKT